MRGASHAIRAPISMSKRTATPPLSDAARALRAARRGLGLSQGELGARVGYSGRHLCRWEGDEIEVAWQAREPLLAALANAPLEHRTALRRALGLPEAAPNLGTNDGAMKSGNASGTKVDEAASLDGLLYAAAEDLDVSPKRLRATFARLLAELLRTGMSLEKARKTIAKSPPKP
jgi:transcriptional regulator with XRE-family HTH domain